MIIIISIKLYGIINLSFQKQEKKQEKNSAERQIKKKNDKRTRYHIDSTIIFVVSKIFVRFSFKKKIFPSQRKREKKQRYGFCRPIKIKQASITRKFCQDIRSLRPKNNNKRREKGGIILIRF